MNDKFQELCKAINSKAKHQQDLVQSSQNISRSIPAGTHASTPHLTKTVIEIPVKEATKQGYSLCRGGATASTSRCREAKQEEEESG